MPIFSLGDKSGAYYLDLESGIVGLLSFLTSI